MDNDIPYDDLRDLAIWCSDPQVSEVVRKSAAVVADGSQFDWRVIDGESYEDFECRMPVSEFDCHENKIRPRGATWAEVESLARRPIPCLDETKMNGYADQFPGTDDPRVKPGDW